MPSGAYREEGAGRSIIEMAGTELAAGQPAVFTQQEQQQPPTAPQQGVLTFQAWPQGQVYQEPAQAVVGGFPQQRPVQYIAVRTTVTV